MSQTQSTDRLRELLSRILNREPFSYDLNGDALYRQYAHRYAAQGRMAMEDTQGRAAALTGGYGNSYGQTAAQQTYQGYLQQSGDLIPELYRLALSKYQAEGDALEQQYRLAASQAEFDEDVRRFNYKNGLGEFAPKTAAYTYSAPKPDTDEVDWEALYRRRYEAEQKAKRNGGFAKDTVAALK